MLIHCLIDYDGRIYHLANSSLSSDTAAHFDLAQNTYLCYQYDLYSRRLWSKPEITEAPFCPRPAHEEAVKKFFDEMVGAPEKLIDYAKRGGIAKNDLVLLLADSARAKCREAFESATAVFAEQRMAAETALNAAFRPAYLDCHQKLLDTDIKHKRAFVETLRQSNEAAAQNEVWQTEAVTKATEEFCRQLSEEYGKFASFVQHHQNPFFGDAEELFHQRVECLNQRYNGKLKKISEEYAKNIQILIEELRRKHDAISKSCDDDADRLCNDSDKIVVAAMEIHCQTLKSARQAFDESCIAAWLALFQKPENRIEIWRS